MTDPTTRLTNFYNALDQIKAIATLHYIGGAFDPEHMRTLAIIAADAMNGREIPPVPDAYEIREQGRRLAEEHAKWVEE